MKIAILGSSGFLGNIIKSKFLEKYDVFPIDRGQLNLIDFNSVSSWLDSQTFDVIINCAISGGKQNVQQFNLIELQSNLSIFLNFYNNSHKFGKFVNIGSGAEFDKDLNIENAKEEEILLRAPTASYGYGKNLISRLCLEKRNFQTLRLFGCFHHTEPDFRLFKRFIADESITIENRKFDYISAEDFVSILEYSINNDLQFKDINCVYTEKFLLSEILSSFKPPTNVKPNPNNYTGDGSKLASLNLPLLGLKKSIEMYKKEIL